MILIEKIGSNNIVDLALAKSYIKVENSDDDTVIQLLTDSALEMIEDFLGFDLFAKKYIQYNREELIIPIERMYVDEIISVKDKNGTEIDYQVHGEWNAEVTLIVSVHQDVYTTFTTKNPIIQNVFKTAILMQVAHMYENRGDTNITPEVAQLLAGKKMNLWL